MFGSFFEAVVHPLVSLLLTMNAFTHSFGVSIFLFTLLMRSLLLPLSIQGMKSQKEMQLLKPKLDELKKKFAKEPTKLQQAQAELYKKEGINPVSGCIPYLAQFFILIVLYQALDIVLKAGDQVGVMQFFWMNLSKPDQYFVLPVIAGVSQFILSVMILPGAEKHDLIPNASKVKKVKQENKKEDDMLEMAETMQKQMIFTMPIITGIMAMKFPSGLAWYWVVSTLYSIAQQWYVSGPGALSEYARKVRAFITRAEK